MKEKNLNDFLPDKNSSYYKKFKNNESNKSICKKDIVDQIKKVMDPEIPVNLYDLGLIYKKRKILGNFFGGGKIFSRKKTS